jgi:hypothetical protein
MGIQANHLVELAAGGMIASQIFRQTNAIPLMEVHGSVGGEGRGEGGWKANVLILA